MPTSSRRRTRRSSPSAFTLIEFIVVIAIIGFLAVAVNTEQLNFTSLRLNAAAPRIRSDIRYAQQLAESIQLRTRMIFTVASDQYTVHYEQTPGNWVFVPDPLTRQNFQVNLNTGDYAGVDLTSASFGGGRGASTLIFDEMGIPYDAAGTALAAPGSVVLNGSKTIEVTDQTGKAKIL